MTHCSICQCVLLCAWVLQELIKSQPSAGKVVPLMDQDILLTWVIIIMLTAQQIGLPFGSSPQIAADVNSTDTSTAASTSSSSDINSITQRFQAQAKGLQGHVKQTLKMYDEGHTLEYIRGLQSAVTQVCQALPGTSKVLSHS